MPAARAIVMPWSACRTGAHISGRRAMASSTGGCLCGSVRYSYDGEPVFAGICHCRNCQKQAGTAFSVVVAVPKPAFSLAGKLKTYNDTGDSGQAVQRNFCPECG